MMTHAHSAASPQTLWPAIRAQAQDIQAKEPLLSKLVQESVLAKDGILPALVHILSSKLATPEVSAEALHAVFKEAYKTPDDFEEAAGRDLICTIESDPAAYDLITPFLFFKGYHALQAHRVAHWLWRQGRKHEAFYFQSRVSSVFGVDIHPAAVIGRGVMMDHATGIVIGETATVGDCVLFYHGVTLGGKGTAAGDRHPKVGNGVQLGAGATVLGPITIGDGANVAAGSVVVNNVEPRVTVAGVPAKVISK